MYNNEIDNINSFSKQLNEKCSKLIDEIFNPIKLFIKKNNDQFLIKKYLNKITYDNSNKYLKEIQEIFKNNKENVINELINYSNHYLFYKFNDNKGKTIMEKIKINNTFDYVFENIMFKNINDKIYYENIFDDLYKKYLNKDFMIVLDNGQPTLFTKKYINDENITGEQLNELLYEIFIKLRDKIIYHILILVILIRNKIFKIDNYIKILMIFENDLKKEAKNIFEKKNIDLVSSLYVVMHILYINELKGDYEFKYIDEIKNKYSYLKYKYY